MSAIDCKKKDDSFLVDKGDAFDFVYPENKKYVVEMKVADKHANTALKRWVLDITGESYSGYFKILSIPKVDEKDGKIEFFVGNNLDNSILYNILYDDGKGTRDCYVDTDITVDSDGDGSPDQDKDFMCNQLYLQKYTPQYDSVVGRIYYQVGDKLLSQDYTVSFLDFEADLNAEQKKNYDTLTQVLNSMDTSGENNQYLHSLLIQLRNGLIDEVDNKSTVVAIHDYLNTTEVGLTQVQQAQLDAVLENLSDDSVIAAQ
ncbi:MAG: hypothetical protein GXP45_07535 [bacterium]|nr:hypothetical protein [bacterium]